MNHANPLELVALLTTRLVALEHEFLALSKQRGPVGDNGVDGNDGRDGRDGKDGDRGPTGKDGRDGQDGKQGPRGLPGKDGADGKDGTDGEKGDIGPAPKHRWMGTELQFQKPDGKWGEKVELRGGVIVAGGGGGTDLNTLPLGDPTLVPEAVALKQNGQWVQFQWADFLALLPITSSVQPWQVTVNGVGVTANGDIVTVTPDGTVEVNGQAVTVNDQLIQVST